MTKADWEVFGRYFGYPECCIKAFLIGSHRGGPKRKLHGTGYIPCTECNEKLECELLNSIKTNRKHYLPFPEVDNEIADFDLNLKGE